MSVSVFTSFLLSVLISNCINYSSQISLGSISSRSYKKASYGHDDLSLRLTLTRKFSSYERAAMSANTLELFKACSLSYLADLTIGSGCDKQKFTMLVDTGSAVLWIPSTSCISESCKGLKKYDGSKSQTYSQGHSWKSYSFLDGQKIEGRESTDSVNLSDTFIVHNQTFLEVRNIENPINPNGHYYDGLLGLGFGSLTGSNYSILLESMKSQGLIDKMMFSLYLHNEERLDETDERQSIGELSFGSRVDPSRFLGEMVYIPLSRASHWEIRIDKIRLVGGLGYNAAELDYDNEILELTESARVCEYGCRGMIDTGTYMLIGPQYQVDQLNRALGGAPLSGRYEGIYHIQQCHEMASRMPNLIFTINGREFTLSPEQYLIPVKRDQEHLGCLSTIRSLRDLDSSVWILGDIFIGNHYVVFDMESEEIGLAKLRKQRRGLDQFSANKSTTAS